VDGSPYFLGSYIHVVYTCITSTGLPVGSHCIMGRQAQKSGHQFAVSPYWITLSGLASETFHTKKTSFSAKLLVQEYRKTE